MRKRYICITILIWCVLATVALDGPTPEGMVLIPAGEFQMGSNDSEAEESEKPVHTVYLDAFYMDVYEVTNAEYKKFIDANPQWGKDRIPDDYHFGNYLKHWDGDNYPSGRGEHPVVHVSWYGAMAYSQWVGKRLPTEAEWEKAARGGLVAQKYPWGDSIDSSKANYGKTWYAKRVPTTAVGSYAPNDYGLYDMAGNASEWCLDAYNADFYKDSPLRNPIAGVESIEQIMNDFMSLRNPHTLRGGSWASAPAELRIAFRAGHYPIPAYDHTGFRCAKTVDP
ncbi:formylglycine-generating enzyme family protein [Candidatus Poribacteria bacterium]|nr:formylglycine-generating enzyme family protein [Candidatus Poribacteria bacterium]